MSSSEVFRALVSQYLVAARANRAVPKVLGEAALYAPLDQLVNGLALADGRTGTRAVQQARTEFGIPDWVVDAGGPIGYLEAKKPALNLDDLPARDARQVGSFLNLPNLLLTNYRDFLLYENGELVDRVSLGGLEVLDNRRPVEPAEASVDALRALLVRFFEHRVLPPRSVEDLALMLARGARVLHDATLTTLKTAPEGALAGLHGEWRSVLFHEASLQEFADAYAQALTYGLLTARLDMDGRLTVPAALDTLRTRHPFLGAALRLLTDPEALDEVGWAVDLVIQTLDPVSLELFAHARHTDDPLLYFYEDFLARYDAGLRKRRGVYFTPTPVVGFQVRAIAHLLDGLGRTKLLAEDVVALDPAAGTGTYLLDLLDETIGRVREFDGEAAVPAAAATAAKHLNGFEILVGPYTVAHQRLAARLAAVGAGKAPVRVFLVDTLMPPDSLGVGQLRLPFERQLSEERRRADEVKRDEQVVVVLGNPPYERARARGPGDWLQQQMRLFTGPVSTSARVNLKNLADSYVYFFRWALWKLFEAQPAAGPRLLTFISNRSYLGGDAFEGLRLALRQRFDDLWVVDLEGERRGPMASENIFDQIQVGVAIVVGLRRDAGREKDGEATVRYVRIPGSRADKELALKGSLDEMRWTRLNRPGGQALLPEIDPEWVRWSAIDELIPFRQSGVQTKRDALVVGVTPQRLIQQLETLTDPALPEGERRRLFHETAARKLPAEFQVETARIRRYGYRPLDIRWVYDDPRLIDRPRPKLRRVWHNGQKAFVTLPKGHGPGPAVVLQTELPDLHGYRGSFGGHVFPLWLDAAHEEPNLARGFLRLFRSHVGGNPAAEDVFAYVFAVLNAPSYHERFAPNLAQGFPRIPFPARLETFVDLSQLGTQLLGAHGLSDGSAGVRFTGAPGPVADRPSWDEGRLRVSERGYVEPVTEAAWDYSVSGYRVLENWLRRGRAGLDLGQDWALVESLLRVVNAVETTVRLHPRLDSALSRVLDGEVLTGRALLPLDLRSASRDFARKPGALERAAAEADLWSTISDEALFEAEP